MKRFTCLAIVAVNYASAATKCMGHYGLLGWDKEIQETSLEWYCNDCDCRDLAKRFGARKCIGYARGGDMNDIPSTASLEWYCDSCSCMDLSDRSDKPVWITQFQGQGSAFRKCKGHYGPKGDDDEIQETSLEWSCNGCNCKDLSDRDDKVVPENFNAGDSCSTRMKKMDDEWRTTCKNVEYTATGCADFNRECGMWPQQCYGYPQCTSFKTNASCCAGPRPKPRWHKFMDPKALPNGLKDEDYDRYEDGYSWRVQTNSTTNASSISGSWDRKEVDYTSCFYKDNGKKVGNTGDYEHVDDVAKAEQCGKKYCSNHESWMRNECMKQFNTTEAVYYQCKRDVVTYEQECFKQVYETVSHVKNFNITDSSTWKNKNLMQVATNTTNGANSTASTSDAAKLFTTGAASMILTSAVLF